MVSHQLFLHKELHIFLYHKWELIYNNVQSAKWHTKVLNILHRLKKGSCENYPSNLTHLWANSLQNSFNQVVEQRNLAAFFSFDTAVISGAEQHRCAFWTPLPAEHGLTALLLWLVPQLSVDCNW
jgi:hypothetical protein